MGPDGRMVDSMGPSAEKALEALIDSTMATAADEPTELTAWDYKGLMACPKLSSSTQMIYGEVYHIRTNNSTYKIEKRSHQTLPINPVS